MMVPARMLDNSVEMALEMERLSGVTFLPGEFGHGVQELRKNTRVPHAKKLQDQGIMLRPINLPGFPVHSMLA